MTVMKGVAAINRSSCGTAFLGLFLFIVSLFFGGGCGLLPYKEGLPKDPNKFKEFVLEEVNIGDSLDVAKAGIMRIGLEPRHKVFDGLFDDMGSDPTKRYEGIDYLVSSRRSSDLKWSWSVALQFEETEGELIVVDLFVQVHDRRGLPGTTWSTRPR